MLENAFGKPTLGILVAIGLLQSPTGATDNDQHTDTFRVTLLATALNNLGVGALLTGITVPMINDALGDARHIGLWVLLGADLLALAQIVLGRLR